MFIDGSIHQLPDIDQAETAEWLESLDAVDRRQGQVPRALPPRAAHGAGPRKGRRRAARWCRPTTSTRSRPSRSRGSRATSTSSAASARSSAGTRSTMVDRANHRFDGLGGHLSTYASAASLYEVGFNHFFRGKGDGGYGDQVFFQGHAAPGIYARAFLEGRLTEDQLDHFRREVGGQGLPSYPHPRRLPDVLGVPDRLDGPRPAQRGVPGPASTATSTTAQLVDTSNARVWCFVGDGEIDEPEATAALDLAARERLDNLIFVVNCNLQRLDGPVRGNGKVIQEFESTFRGMGWNVIKVVWGRAVGRPARPRRRRRARQQDEHDRSTASSRSTRSSRARTSVSTSSGPTRVCARWSSTSPTTSCSGCRAAGTTTASSTPRTRPRSSTRARRP